MATDIMVYDKKNTQQEMMHMAKSIKDNKYVIGYIVIQKPWYSPESSWKYYIYEEEYNGGGMCGGASSSGFEKVLVDKDTIEPYTQISSIKYNQSIGVDTKLVKSFTWGDTPDEDVVCLVRTDDEIPYELWDNE